MPHWTPLAGTTGFCITTAWQLKYILRQRKHDKFGRGIFLAKIADYEHLTPVQLDSAMHAAAVVFIQRITEMRDA